MGGTRDTSTSTTQGEIMKTFLRRKGIACQLLAAIFIVGINLQSTPSASANARGDDYPYTEVDAVDPWRL